MRARTLAQRRTSVAADEHPLIWGHFGTIVRSLRRSGARPVLGLCARLACVASIQMECSENKETTVALVSHDRRTRVGQPALLRETKARGILHSGSIFLHLFARGLQRGPGLTLFKLLLRSPLL